MAPRTNDNGSGWEKLAVTLLRFAIGWHFLFEGVSKVASDQWTAKDFLASASGPFSGFYHWMASSTNAMAVVDPLNMYGLILIGLALFSGIALRIAAVSGIVLLALYYFAYPPFGGPSYGYSEGVVFLINKNVVEALALSVLLFVKEKGYGIHGLFRVNAKSTTEAEGDAPVNSRREMLKNLSAIPVLGVMGYGGTKEIQQMKVDGFSGATRKLVVPAITDLVGASKGKDRKI